MDHIVLQNNIRQPSSPWIESALLALGLLALFLLAQALALEPAGLNQRYLSEPSPANAVRAAQALWLGGHVGTALIALGFGGLFTLWLARLSVPFLTWASGWVAVWAIVAAVIYPATHAGLFSALGFWPPKRWANDTVAIGVALLLYSLTCLVAGVGPRWRFAAQRPANVWAYPGFVFFTGLGSLWLLDYSARSRFKWRFLGVEHLDMLFVAYVVLSVVVRFAPYFFAVLARMLAHLDRARADRHPAMRAALSAMPVLVCGLWALVIVVVLERSDPGKSSELIRFPAYLLGGWLLYRWGRHPRHAWRAALGAALVTLLTSLALALTHDYGQLMVLAWASAALCGVLVAMGFSTICGIRGISAMVGAAAAVGLIVAGQIGLRSWAAGDLPFSAQPPRHVVERIFALGHPFEGKLEYLSELRWFLRSAPFTGHGLGHVPWCGTVASLDLAQAPVSSCTGTPKEAHSDYVFAALGGVIGLPAAVVLTLALALWLLSLTRSPPLRPGLHSAELAHATGLCFVVVSLMQLLVTALGSVGLIPLTGITFIFLGFGGTSLLVCTVGIGVLLHTPPLKQESSS